MSNHGKIFIPDHEYKERVARAAKILQREKLDVMIVNSNEADYANARYFSGFWPLFERSGVAISASGDAALMVGPESREFAADRSRLEKIFVLKEYRESADPAYPELKADTYQDDQQGAAPALRQDQRPHGRDDLLGQRFPVRRQGGQVRHLPPDP